MPRGDQALLNYGKIILAYAGESDNSERWEVPGPQRFIEQPLTDFEEALKRLLDPNRGRVDLVNKNEQKKLLDRGLRTYIQGFLVRNPNVTVVDRTAMNIPIYDTTPTTVPPPAIPVTGILSFPATGLVEMREIRAAGEKRDERSKYGVRIYYGIIGGIKNVITARPATGDDLPYSVFTRQKRYRFDFTGESGKEIFFCMRYENSKGQAGPWGKIISAFVP